MHSADERMAPSDEGVEGIPAAGTGDRCADGSRISEADRNAERRCSAGVEDLPASPVAQVVGEKAADFGGVEDF